MQWVSSNWAKDLPTSWFGGDQIIPVPLAFEGSSPDWVVQVQTSSAAAAGAASLGFYYGPAACDSPIEAGGVWYQTYNAQQCADEYSGGVLDSLTSQTAANPVDLTNPAFYPLGQAIPGVSFIDSSGQPLVPQPLGGGQGYLASCSATCTPPDSASSLVFAGSNWAELVDGGGQPNAIAPVAVGLASDAFAEPSEPVTLTFTYYYLGAEPPAPQITGFNPTTASAGASLDVQGTGLSWVTQLCFGGTAPSDCQSAYPSDDSDIYVDAPAGLGGSVPVTAVDPYGQSSTLDVAFGGAQIDEVQSYVNFTSTGGPGDEFMLSGTGLDGLTGLGLYSDSGGSETEVAALTSCADDPACAGSSNWDPVTGTVGDYQPSQGDPEQVNFTLPNIGVGTYDVVATTAAGSTPISPSDEVTVVGPAVTAVQPSRGMPGDVVTLSTSAANEVTGVSVGGVALQADLNPSDFYGHSATPGMYNSSYSGQIALSLPLICGSGVTTNCLPSSGSYDVTVTSGGLTSSPSSSDEVTVAAGSAPVITGVEAWSPIGTDDPSLPIGTEMTIDVQGTALEDVTSGTIDDVDAACSYAYYGGSDVYCTVPSGLASGSYDLVLQSTLNGASAPFSIAVVAEGVPVVTVVTPGTMASNPLSSTYVVISGDGLYNATGASFVSTTTGQSYPANSLQYSYADDGTWEVGIPYTVNWSNYSNSAAIPPDTYDVIVTTPVGTSVATPTDQFTLTP
jgi:hypothetical protein